MNLINFVRELINKAPFISVGQWAPTSMPRGLYFSKLRVKLYGISCRGDGVDKGMRMARPSTLTQPMQKPLLVQKCPIHPSKYTKWDPQNLLGSWSLFIISITSLMWWAPFLPYTFHLQSYFLMGRVSGRDINADRKKSSSYIKY